MPMSILFELGEIILGLFCRVVPNMQVLGVMPLAVIWRP